MRFFIGVTDSDWLNHLRALQPDEVNFWRPSGAATFRSISPGEPYLFKKHGSPHVIVGGGFLVTYSPLPASLAWDAFGPKNGTRTLTDLVTRVRKYSSNAAPDPIIGCTILTEPFFLPESEWIEIPDWKNPIVQGKGYSTGEEVGSYIWSKVTQTSAFAAELLTQPEQRFEDRLVKQRLGQGSFRILVTESYHKRCTATGEKTLPVLQAAHIKPYSHGGEHKIDNGLLLRADLHILFDRGYLTITPDLKVEVSNRIKEEFTNGKDYYKLHGISLTNLPDDQKKLPSRDLLTWHNDNIYQRPIIQL